MLSVDYVFSTRHVYVSMLYIPVTREEYHVIFYSKRIPHASENTEETFRKIFIFIGTFYRSQGYLGTNLHLRMCGTQYIRRITFIVLELVSQV